MAGSRNRKHVQYEQTLVTYVDILGFGELIQSRSAGEISKILRVFTEAIEPERFKTAIPDIPSEDFITCSDLSITMIPLRRVKAPPQGAVFYQLLRLIHAQATLFHDHRIVVRGGVAVGQATKSYRRIFGPAVIRAYEIESKVAKYPRIVVDRSVLDELKMNRGPFEARPDGRAVPELSV